MWHDELPLLLYGGRIFVTVPPVAREQVGTFVHHGHIPSYQNVGMTATIEVFDLAGHDTRTQFTSLSTYAAASSGSMAGHDQPDQHGTLSDQPLAPRSVTPP